MEIRRAGPDDVGALAELLWRFAHLDGSAAADPGFADELFLWWEAHRDSHVPFLALRPAGTAVGMAWLAVTARAPRPGTTDRLCGDVQSLFVVPEHRSAGVGTALVRAVLQHAGGLGLEHVTVHANERAVSVYERLGFAVTCDLLMWTPASPAAHPSQSGVT